MKPAGRAVILLSGGLDSAVALADCRAHGYTPFALTIDYGQRHRRELEAAHRVAEAFGCGRHVVLAVDLTRWGGSALTSDMEIPVRRHTAEIGKDIPATYVPARNTIFLSLAMAWAEVLGTGDVYIGAHALDYSGYPDCRPEYFRAFERMADYATRSGAEGATRWKIHAPLLNMTKADIIRRGMELHVPFELTHSCYQPVPTADSSTVLACGICDACVIRRSAFETAGVVDPIPYVAPANTRP